MKRENINTPVGTAIWPTLNEPSTRFKPEGEFSCTLRLEASSAQKVIEQINSFHDRAYRHFCELEGKSKLKKAGMCYSVVTGDNGEETGEFDFKFKLKHRVEPRRGDAYEQTVALFDAQGTPMKDHVGGGSKLRINGLLNPWYTASLGFGVSLWIKAAQIIELVEGAGGGSSKSFGFEAMSGGFTTSGESFDFEDDAKKTAKPSSPEDF